MKLVQEDEYIISTVDIDGQGPLLPTWINFYPFLSFDRG